MDAKECADVLAAPPKWYHGHGNISIETFVR